MGIVGRFIGLVSGAVLLTRLYNGTGGSLLLAILFHGAIDAGFDSPVMHGSVAAIVSTLYIVRAIPLVIFAGPANLSRRGEHTLE